MTAIIFVHGTGGREVDYAATFHNIEEKLDKLNRELKLVPCLWGKPDGTKLNASGASIPDYDSTGGTTQSNNHEADGVQLWEKLYTDSLYEIRLLSIL